MNLKRDPDDRATHLAEARHSLRSAIGSLLGKIDQIVQGYESVRTATPEVVYDRLIVRPAYGKWIKQLQYAAEELLALTENIRVMAGENLELQITSIDIKEMIAKCLDIFADEIARRDLSCNLFDRIPKGGRELHGDRAWLQILVFNLIENAVKYSRQGGRINLELWLQGPFWRFSVTSEGKYIPPEWRADIFEPFLRIEAEPDEQMMPGTGIGLYSVKTIANLHQLPGIEPPGGCPVLVSSEFLDPKADRSRQARNVFTVSIPRNLGNAHAE